MSLTIRQAAVDDLQVLWEIEKECFSVEAFTREEIAYLLRFPAGVNLVAQIDHKIVGFILSLTYKINKIQAGHIFTIDVLVEHRRKGVASKLLRELERSLTEKNIKTCFLEVRTDNVAALKLYQKHGYTEVEHLKNYYGNEVDGLRLKKKFSLKR